MSLTKSLKIKESKIYSNILNLFVSLHKVCFKSHTHDILFKIKFIKELSPLFWNNHIKKNQLSSLNLYRDHSINTNNRN